MEKLQSPPWYSTTVLYLFPCGLLLSSPSFSPFPTGRQHSEREREEADLWWSPSRKLLGYLSAMKTPTEEMLFGACWEILQRRAGTILRGTRAAISAIQKYFGRLKLSLGTGILFVLWSLITHGLECYYCHVNQLVTLAVLLYRENWTVRFNMGKKKWNFKATEPPRSSDTN